jgi:hypothetical protein
VLASVASSSATTCDDGSRTASSIRPGERHNAGWRITAICPISISFRSRPLAISALFCIDPFTTDTGATDTDSGLAAHEQFPSMSSPPISTRRECGAGFVHRVRLDGVPPGWRQWLRPARARGQSRLLGAIIAQQISLPEALDGRYADDPALARLLGYGVVPAPSVAAWRERRLARQRSASASATTDTRS